MGFFDLFKKKTDVNVKTTVEEKEEQVLEQEEPKVDSKIQRAAGIAFIQNSPEILARVELYCQVRGVHFDDQIERINFFIEERDNLKETFSKAMDAVGVMQNVDIMHRAELYAKLAGQNFSNSAQIAAFFAEERNAGSPEFKERLEAVNVLENETIMEKAMCYAKLVGEKFKTPEELAVFFVKERSNPERFRDVFNKAIQISQVLNNEQLMNNAKAFAKLSEKTFETPFELAEFFVNNQQKQTQTNGR